MKAPWWREELENKRSLGLHRALRVLPPDVLDLASNDYLGLSRHPEVIRAATEATQSFGAGARASRLVSGHFEVHAELERKLAAFKKCEAGLVFPSGYHANLAVITSLARAGDAIFCDKRNHASLIDACFLASARGVKLRFYDSLPKLRTLLENSSAPVRLIVADAVYSMDGDLAPVPELAQLAAEFEALLILDDAHGTGVLGAIGRGTLEYFEDCGRSIPRATIIQIGTLSKAIGSQGGFVVGDGELIEWLVNAARSFIYTTGLNPAAGGGALASLEIIEREPQRLRRLGEVKALLASGLRACGLVVNEQPSPILPVMVGGATKAVELSGKLLEKNIWCPAIRPPTVPQNASRLRVTARADLSNDEIAGVLRAFGKC